MYFVKDLSVKVQRLTIEGERERRRDKRMEVAAYN